MSVGSLSRTPSQVSFTSDNEAPEDPLDTPIYLDKQKKHHKIITQLGDGVDKPGPICEVIIRIAQDGQEFSEEREVKLGRGTLPDLVEKAIVTMRQNEICEVNISATDTFAACKCRLHLISWTTVYDIKGDGVYIKRIYHKGFGYERADLRDELVINCTITSSGETLFSSQDWQVLMDPSDLSDGLYDILSSVKLQEHSNTIVSPNTFSSNFSKFLKNAKIESEVYIDIEVKDLKKVDDMYLDGTFFKRTLVDGEGKSIPNSNARLKVFYEIAVQNENVLSNFGREPLEIILDECDVPSLWSNCFRHMKEGDKARIECNLLGLSSEKASDGLTKMYNIDTYLKDSVSHAEVILQLDSFTMGKTNYNMSLQERAQESLRLKEAGTKLFKAAYFDRALEKYETSLSTLQPFQDDPHNYKPIQHAVLNNISLCHMKLGNWHESINHATKVLEIDSNDVKALYRRSIGRKNILDYDSALLDLRNAKEICLQSGDKSMLKDVLHEIKHITDLLKTYKIKEKELYKNLFK